MENIGANKTLGNLSWEELLKATSSETIRDQRNRDNASFGGSERMKMDNALQETIHQERVCEHCGEKNIPTNMSQHHEGGKCLERKEFIKKMKDDYQGGMPLLQVAKKYGYSYSGLEYVFNQEGIEIKSNKQLDEDKVWEMLTLLDKGVGKMKIAEMFGVNYATFYKILKGKTWVDVVKRYNESK